MKKLAIWGALLVVLGGILFVVALAASGWDISRLSTNGPMEERSLAVDNRQQDIILSEHDTPVAIGLSNDNQIHLQYAENKRESYTIADEGTLKIEKNIKPLAFIFNFEFDFNSKFTLLLPKDFQGNVTIKNTNASITLSKLDLQELLLKTSNGRVELEDVTAKTLEVQSSNNALELNNVQVQDSIVCDTTNGRVKLEGLTAKSLEVKSSNNGLELNNIQAQDSIVCTTSNGKLQLSDIVSRDFEARTSSASIVAENIYADDSLSLDSSNGRLDVDALLAGKEISLTTTNASITGSLRGSMRDFSIDAKTSNASNNLPEEMTGGQKDMKVRTSNGPIKLTFDDTDTALETRPKQELKKEQEAQPEQDGSFSVRE